MRKNILNRKDGILMSEKHGVSKRMLDEMISNPKDNVWDDRVVETEKDMIDFLKHEFDITPIKSLGDLSKSEDALAEEDRKIFLNRDKYIVLGANYRSDNSDPLHASRWKKFISLIIRSGIEICRVQLVNKEGRAKNGEESIDFRALIILPFGLEIRYEKRVTYPFGDDKDNEYELSEEIKGIYDE